MENAGGVIFENIEKLRGPNFQGRVIFGTIFYKPTIWQKSPYIFDFVL